MNASVPLSAEIPDPRALELRKRKGWALIALLGALTGLAGAHFMGGAGLWGWLRAGCEAAAVGALADWFAVVALFRRPLGLPIPHTALIPNSKARIADSLAAFVRDHFMQPEVLLQKLKLLDPASRLGEWLREPERMQHWAAEGRQWALGALDTLNDERVRSVLLDMVRKQAHRWDAAGTASEILGLLTRDGRHHELMNAGLQQVGALLGSDEIKHKVADMLLKHVGKDYPAILKGVQIFIAPDKLARHLAERISASALGELEQVMTQAEHPLRQRYEAWLQDYVGRLGQDEKLRQRVEALKARTLDDPAVGHFVSSLWADVKARLRADLQRDDSALAAYLAGALRGFGQRLADDAQLRAAINERVLSSAAHLAEQLRGGITTHISQTIKSWDDQQLTREVELSIGADLQYIRLNGTLIGGLAGVVLYGLSRLF